MISGRAKQNPCIPRHPRRHPNLLQHARFLGWIVGLWNIPRIFAFDTYSPTLARIPTSNRGFFFPQHVCLFLCFVLGFFSPQETLSLGSSEQEWVSDDIYEASSQAESERALGCALPPQVRKFVVCDAVPHSFIILGVNHDVWFPAKHRKKQLRHTKTSRNKPNQIEPDVNKGNQNKANQTKPNQTSSTVPRSKPNKTKTVLRIGCAASILRPLPSSPPPEANSGRRGARRVGVYATEAFSSRFADPGTLSIAYSPSQQNRPAAFGSR